jgi:DNA helicase-2/ATP-dependent DNA helicase PcrA
LVLKSVPREILERRVVCVVGNRVNPAQHTRDNWPAFLGDYWESYISPRAAKTETPDTLLGYIVEARRKWGETGTGSEPYNLAISGILALLRRTVAAGPESVPRTKASLHQALLQRGRLVAFQGLLWQLLNPVITLDERKWVASAKDLLLFLQIRNPSDEVSGFLSWENCVGARLASGTKSVIKTQSVYMHSSGGISLPIRFASIHGVKGETHAATLVVETYARQHDLKELLPVLTAAQRGSQLRNAARGHCKRVFVGMSRPSHLLCLAISAEHVSDPQVSALNANGWKVLRV